MERTIDQRLLKISTKSVFVDKTLEPEDEVEIIVRGVVDNVAARPNYDGTVNMIYTVKGQIADVKKL